MTTTRQSVPDDAEWSSSKAWILFSFNWRFVQRAATRAAFCSSRSIRSSAYTPLQCVEKTKCSNSPPPPLPLPGKPGLAGLLELRMMEVVVTTGAIRRAKLQSNRHHQQTNTQVFTGRMSFLSPNQRCQSTEGTKCCKCTETLTNHRQLQSYFTPSNFLNQQHHWNEIITNRFQYLPKFLTDYHSQN